MYAVATLKKAGMRQVFKPEKTNEKENYAIHSSFYDVYYAVFKAKSEADKYYERISQ